MALVMVALASCKYCKLKDENQSGAQTKVTAAWDQETNHSLIRRDKNEVQANLCQTVP